ncbi:sigma-70 family RNA polymerase sigma factor [Streptomyces europaeiscabiei]|uniref:RNA polymerase sigma factor n=1 Tax=Streptomyces europaeiscabiei TaxID=146819 RepID=UPI0029B44448|nr:sigma-70 family RNA polymerase sigma factor [Streptomyces europaeiscabiei]MDX3697324.1 sigma-70 family RNA polymerase sigma factor [Streptomyces europaeiscabiei]
MTPPYTSPDRLGSHTLEPGRYRLAPHPQQPGDTPLPTSRDLPPRFEEFYSRYFDKARRIAAYKCGPSNVGEDIASEAMIAMWEKWEDVRTGKIDKPVHYFYGVLGNVINQHHKRTSKQAEALQKCVEPKPDEEPAEHTAVSNIEVANMVAMLQTALTRQQLEVFVCRYVLVMTTGEIADRMEMSAPAVRKTLSTATQKLKIRYVRRRA